jgi:hypothetical protein
LPRERVELAAQLVELSRERGHGGRERLDALTQRGDALFCVRITLAALHLRERRLGLAERALRALLRDAHVGLDL